MSNILEQYFFRVKSNLEHPLTSKSAKGLYKELKEKSWDSAMVRVVTMVTKFDSLLTDDKY